MRKNLSQTPDCLYHLWATATSYDTIKNKAKHQKPTNLKFLNEFFGTWGRDNDVSLRRLDKAIINSFVDECQEIIVVAINVQQTHLLIIEYIVKSLK